jgi:hypothetical protein
MCFSAIASFSSGIILGTIGAVTLKTAPKNSHRPFAAIPLIFALQQITEGFLWLCLKGKIDAGWEQLLTYQFIIIAQVIWPFWVPFSMLLLEQKQKRKNLFYLLITVGILFSLTIAYRLLFYPVYVTIEEHHISYHLAFPVIIHYGGSITYLIVILASPFVSTVKRMSLVGFLTLFSFIAAELLYTKYIISVWCFFAAIISIAVYAVVREQRKIPAPIDAYKISDYQF